MGSSNPKEREEAARRIGSTFSLLENKEQASKDLLELTKDEDSDVGVSANHSLGKISVYRATRTVLEIQEYEISTERDASLKFLIIGESVDDLNHFPILNKLV